MCDDTDAIGACARDWVFNRLGPDYRNDWPLPAALAAWLVQDPRHFDAFLHARRLWLLGQLLKPPLAETCRGAASLPENPH